MADVGTARLSEPEERLLAEVSRDQLWQHAETLAQWEKISGTPGERAAVDYLRSRLKAFGLQVEEHWFESLLGWPQEAQLELRSGDGGSFQAITHSFTPSTPTEGVEAEVAYAARGEESDFAGVARRIALVEGIAAPLRVLRASQAGAAGVVFINEDRLHDMCVSPVWGTPTTRTAPLLPRIPAVSVRRPDGERLKELASSGSLRVRMRTKTFWGWRPTPLLVGALRGRVEPERFVMFSGHHCSWYYGAMDNGTANATMLEVARVLSEHRDQLHRSVRIAFWPGHTQGRYSGSTWYFDHFWEDLHDNCVLHINADSTGARGASIYRALSMPETCEFAIAAVRDAIGEEAEPERQSRAGDQSFWACGIPSIFMDLSQVPPELAARASSASLFTATDQPTRHQPGGLPWWWHTPDDTIDKIDADVLRNDTRVFLLATLRAAAAPLLPFRYLPAAREVRQTIERYQEAAGDRIDLAPAARRAREVEERAVDVGRLLDRTGAGQAMNFERVGAINAALMAMDRELVMLNFTSEGPFDQDLAIPIPAVPLLEPARRLATLDPASDEAHFLATDLVRNRNKAVYHLRLATEAAGRAAAALSDALVS
jgi:Iap family predicted aminopeptidase